MYTSLITKLLLVTMLTLLVGVGLLVAPGGRAMTSTAARTFTAAALQQRKPLFLPIRAPRRPVGIGAVAVKPGATPPFTKQDVISYFQKHNLPKNAGPVDKFQVDTLEFITSGDVSKRLRSVSTGLKDSEPVGFARLSGTLIFSGPQGKPVTFKQGYAIFDAATGNLLMIGTL